MRTRKPHQAHAGWKGVDGLAERLDVESRPNIKERRLMIRSETARLYDIFEMVEALLDRLDVRGGDAP